MKSLLAALLLGTPAAAIARPIDYRIDIGSAQARPVVTITLRFTGDADGETDLDLPSEWAGSDTLWRNLNGWHVTGGTMADTDRPERKHVRHKPGALITIRYRVTDPDPMPPGPEYLKALPWIERGWFSLHGEGVIVIPTGRDNAPARFRWGTVPRGWRVASNLDMVPKLTASQAAQSIFIGGRDLRLIERSVAGAPLRFALLGRWGFTDAQLADHTQAVLQAENAMLGAAPIPFLVTLTPLTNPSGKRLSYGGTGRTAGFALEGTANLPFSGLPRLLGHEYAHRWFFSPEADDAARYWLTEGFNDWFSAQAMLRTGDWDAARWTKELNEVLKRHATSPALALTPQQRFDRFWTDQAAGQFPYDEGQLTATIIDAQLRAAGQPGLLALLIQVNRAGGLGDRPRMEATIERALPGVLARTAAWLSRDGLAQLPADLLPCGTMAVTAGVPQFTLTEPACPALAGRVQHP